MRALLLLACLSVLGAAPAGGGAALVRETTDETFDRDVLEPGRPAVVEYWAHWCWPCFRLAPHVGKLATRHAGQVVFWKLNMGWSAERTRKYHVPTVPTLIFYKNGHEVALQVGMPSPSTDAELEKFVEEGLRASP